MGHLLFSHNKSQHTFVMANRFGSTYEFEKKEREYNLKREYSLNAQNDNVSPLSTDTAGESHIDGKPSGAVTIRTEDGGTEDV